MKLTTFRDAEFLASEWLGTSSWEGRSVDEQNLARYLWEKYAQMRVEEFSDQIDDVFELIENLR
jgi:hypothetical protein